MKDHTLDIVTPIQFRDTSLIPIKINLEQLFGTNQIQFQIYIKENKIIIESPEISTPLEIQDKHQELEVINVS